MRGSCGVVIGWLGMMTMLIHRYVTILVVAFVALWSPVKAEHISIIGGEIPFVFHHAKPGPHNTFYEQVLRKCVSSHEIKYLPYRRAVRDFAARGADCLYVATDTKENYPKDAIANNEIIFSNTINRINLHAYTRRDAPVIKSLMDLAGKTIAGAPSHLEKLSTLPNLKNKLNTISTINHIKAFDLLERERVDVVLAYEFDHALSEAGQNSDPHHFNNDFIINTTNEVVACWVSPDTTEFINTLNTAIAKWRESKKLDALFGRSGGQ